MSRLLKGIGIIVFVIIVIVVIAAIMISSYSHSSIISNEKAAILALKQLVQAEIMWAQKSPDSSEVSDYWTYDISCLYRTYRADGKTRVAYIPQDVARADIAPSDPSNGNPFGGRPIVEVWVAGNNTICQPKSGYWFSVMINNNLIGQTNPIPSVYNIYEVGDGSVRAANGLEFGFMAAPDTYASTGIRSFIVNEEGIIYGADTSAIGEMGTGYGPGTTLGKPGTPPKAAPIRWTTDRETGDILAWPTKDPTTRCAKSDKHWEIVN